MVSPVSKIHLSSIRTKSSYFSMFVYRGSILDAGPSLPSRNPAAVTEVLACPTNRALHVPKSKAQFIILPCPYHFITQRCVRPCHLPVTQHSCIRLSEPPENAFIHSPEYIGLKPNPGPSRVSTRKRAPGRRAQSSRSLRGSPPDEANYIRGGGDRTNTVARNVRAGSRPQAGAGLEELTDEESTFDPERHEPQLRPPDPAVMILELPSRQANGNPPLYNQLALGVDLPSPIHPARTFSEVAYVVILNRQKRRAEYTPNRLTFSFSRAFALVSASASWCAKASGTAGDTEREMRTDADAQTTSGARFCPIECDVTEFSKSGCDNDVRDETTDSTQVLLESSTSPTDC
ncbi:hypothetical protein K438DRAFT_1957577 [Mycena galopus ATCC 62051]|nr:hypothetical protein K438DRAFT_1957577 [Mycena galopus ATCC 62051]